MREWISGFGCSLPSIPKAFISKVFTGGVVIILPNLTVANTEWLWATSDRWRRRP